MVRLLVLVGILAIGQAVCAQYQQGYFYTLDHKQVKGKIKFAFINSGRIFPSSVPGWIKFRAENDKKYVEISADEMRGFVIGVDSFVVLKNIPVSPQHIFRRDFVKVEVLGSLNVYIHYSQAPSGRFGSHTRKVYILHPRGSKKMRAIYNRYQKEEFLSLIADDLGLCEEVRSDWQWMDKIPQLVRRYNSRFAEVNAKN